MERDIYIFLSFPDEGTVFMFVFMASEEIL